MQKEGEKNNKKTTVIQIIAWLAKMQTPAEVAAHSLGQNVKEAF